MELKDILVHIDNSKQCDARVDFAISVAKRHQAHLTGLCIIPSYPPGPKQSDEERMADEAKTKFIYKTNSSEITSDWLCIESFKVVEILRLFTSYKDLVIVSQPDPEHRYKETPSDLPERLILGTGRPVLVVPYVGEFNSLRKHVMVAWRGGRESARSLNDALPFLEKAEQVSVLEVNPPVIDDGPLKNVCCLEICSHLARHGISAESEQLISKDIPVGDTLLNWSFDQGVDLMVLGAVANNHIGGQTLGPVGRHILHHMTIPALISH